MMPRWCWAMACLISGALVAYVSTGWAGLLRSLPMLLLVGATMGLTQWFVATRGLWTLGSTIRRAGRRSCRRGFCAFAVWDATIQSANPHQPTRRGAWFWLWLPI